MAIIENGIIVVWPSTVASIPSGWSRKTELDSRYVRISLTGNDADLTTNNGNTSHTHTHTAHTHTITGGTHTAVRHPNTSPITTVMGTHSHPSVASANATITVDASTNDYLRLDVIFIMSDGTPTGIPSTAIAMYLSDGLPTS